MHLLTGYAPELAYSPLTVNDDNTVGGFARIATIIKNEKNSDGITLVLDAGDFLMGTLFQGLSTNNRISVLRLMKTMGYDAVCMAIISFDLVRGKLASIINSAASGGAIPICAFIQCSFLAIRILQMMNWVTCIAESLYLRN